ncbi:unnamed protein product [Owenia fusiformis]|uniref:Uncharacterized protein n=1 Tax=Owenia fusiformis TaxID=6347 RepID=A0A8J1UU25_OWEFU|nr:unnamed protein product [Owenia fusiformis]
MFLYVFGCLLVFMGSSIAQTPEECMNQNLPRTPEAGETVEFYTHPYCMNASITWNYPQGAVRARFQLGNGGHNFDICLTHSDVSFIEDIYDETSGLSRRISAPTPGSDTCVSSSQAEAVIRFVAPNVLYYVTYIPYYINGPL